VRCLRVHMRLLAVLLCGRCMRLRLVVLTLLMMMSRVEMVMCRSRMVRRCLLVTVMRGMLGLGR